MLLYSIIIGLIFSVLLLIPITLIPYVIYINMHNYPFDVNNTYKSEVRREQKLENNISKYVKKQIDKNTVGRNRDEVEIKKIEIKVKDNNVRWVVYYQFNSS